MDRSEVDGQEGAGMDKEWKNWHFPETEDQPYFHCKECELNHRNGGPCKVADRYQKFPCKKYRGALGMCMKIGGKGC